MAERARRGQRARPVRLLRPLDLDAETPVHRREAPEVRQHAVEPGELDARHLLVGLGRDERRAEQLARERQHVVDASRACRRPGDPADRAPARAARTPPRARSPRTASTRGPRGAPRAPGNPRSSRSSGGPGGADRARLPRTASPDACARRCRTVEPGGPAGSSRSTVALLRSDEHRQGGDRLRDRGQRHRPIRVAARRDRRRRRRHAGRGERHAPSSSIWRSACTPGDTRRRGAAPDLRSLALRARRRLLAGGRGRAHRVHVAGTAPIPADGSTATRGRYEQATLCLAIIGEALARAGASFDRRRAHTDLPHRRRRLDEFARAHGEVFGEIRPAATRVVAQLLDPAWKVEIEAEAVLP